MLANEGGLPFQIIDLQAVNLYGEHKQREQQRLIKELHEHLSKDLHKQQRVKEITYLQNLLSQQRIPFVDQTYTSLAGEFSQDGKLISDEWMPALFKYQTHSKDTEPKEVKGKTEHRNDVIQAFAEYKKLVLLGEPGAGKTFSLWRIASEQARKALADPSAALPIVIPLNKWTRSGQTLHEFMLQQLGDLSPQYPHIYQAKRWIPLLDALNEIPFDQRNEKIPQVAEWLNQDFSFVLLTCRKRDYRGALEQDFDRLIIEPLDPLRIREFLHNYFTFFARRV